ncbi:TrmH family RNA methyltransferase [Hyphomonas johnsonii]|uniref:RNA methyltransferase n=1 Tax=Hyphomonas johnsonii MHS-2 TaxID=1280950 RepID=A0A059FH69_9PROT|nr:RNA methyltransferase [Hyphomonas johnsonii]KCZ89985.1 RNA methyltransferase [Hyphomonas johnsonii MHS-2]
MPILPIADPADPRLAPYTSIREKDLTSGHGGRFIVEGKVTLETLLRRSRFKVESLFLCETRLEPLADILAHVPEDVPVYVAPQDVMDDVAGFPMHRGVLACGVKGEAKQDAALILSEVEGRARAARGASFDFAQDEPLPSTILMLSDLSNHDNVGACFRNAAAFGADAVLLDGRCCDPLYRKAIRVSSGASLWLPFAHGGSGAEMVKAAQAAGYTVWAMTPRADAAPLGSLPVPDRLAILLGAEGQGLPAELIAAAVPVRIPMAAGFDSINVATAGAIALGHAFAARA